MSSTSTEPRRLGPAGLACLVTGSGPPLVFLPGLGPHHRPPAGLDRRFQLAQVRPFARRRRVWWVQRRENLPAGTTMASIAADYAAAIRQRFGGPVDLAGSSTGGSVALQLAADHPDVVRRVVLLSSACRLGDGGRTVQRELAAAVRAGRRRRAGALMFATLAGGPVAHRALAAAGRLLGPAMLRGDCADMLTVIDAEDAFDLTARLPAIAAPVLVVGGGRDRFYGAAVFRETADGLPNGRLLLHPRLGHVAAQSAKATVAAVDRFLAEPPG
ncbi:alpha/beta fold hydrolase [Amycolatopsis tucumanensis]|uniref:Uncharacterized protein n=1 Tax=Amycolatopsis tucumanensis TaxID=401106 RepID=A0ABP7HLH4_9PSEU|nr:alpha/beta hydrolase [Amycolatopsis tucumanensis]MCF6420633.1 alpha/beta hydrolase [Amycolatopsis tucumanensis]